MKLDIMFVRYLLRRGDKSVPREVRSVSKRFDKFTRDYAGDASELRAFGAILMVNSEFDGNDSVTGLTGDVLAALENHSDDFSNDSWGTDTAFAVAIHQLGCAEGAFKIMAKATGAREDPTTKFDLFLEALQTAGVTLPTAEQWAELKPKPKKKRGKSKKK